MTIVLIIIAVILLIFLIGKIVRDIGEGVGVIAVGIAYVVKGIKNLFSKIKRKKRTVIVHCPFGHDFEATPRKKDNWFVQCPECGRNLRVDLEKGKEEKK